MRNVCKGFINGNLAAMRGRSGGDIPGATRAVLTLPLEAALVQVLEAFVELQEARHQADYDTTKVWNRLEVANHVATARSAFQDWQSIRRVPNATVFLVALLLQRHWGR
jgi:hypothetical protein